MLTQTELVEALERRAAAVRASMAAVCRRAGVAVSGPPRWKAGTVSLRLDTYHRLNSALLEIEAEFTAAAPVPSCGKAGNPAPLPAVAGEGAAGVAVSVRPELGPRPIFDPQAGQASC
jgi:hypothetical protein